MASGMGAELLRRRLPQIAGVYLALPLEPEIDSLLVGLSGPHPILLGGLLGIAYVVAELPNSAFKRRLGIAPGQLPARNRFWFALMDQADSAV